MNKKIRPTKYESKQISPPRNCPYMPKTIKIRENTYNKGVRIGKLVTEVLGPYEFQGFLLGKNGIIEEIFIPEKQSVNEAETLFRPSESSQIPENLKEYEYVGWWHSHGRYDSDFLSSTDEKNISSHLAMSNTRMEKNGVGFNYLYSIVSNGKGEVNSYIDVNLQCGAHVRKSIHLELVPGGSEYNEEALKEEIKQKISFGIEYEPPPELREETITYKPSGAWENKVYGLIKNGHSLRVAVTKVGMPPRRKK